MIVNIVLRFMFAYPVNRLPALLSLINTMNGLIETDKWS